MTLKFPERMMMMMMMMMKMPMTVQRLGFYKCILFRLNTLHGMLVSCTSKNVIYVKTCAECGLVNKGETGDVQKTERRFTKNKSEPRTKEWWELVDILINFLRV